MKNRDCNSYAITIGQLAQRTDCSIDNIRYYEAVGLLPDVNRTPSGHRIYFEAHLRRLIFIRQCRSLGFSLAEISYLLELIEDDACQCQAIEHFLHARVEAVRRSIHRLKTVESILSRLAQRCHSSKKPRCPAVDYFFEQHDGPEPLGHLSISANLNGPATKTDSRHLN